MIKYRIPITGLKVSTNKFYAGTSNWNKRKELKDIILDYATSYCQPDNPVSTYPVQISYRFLFRTRALDTLNTAIMAKMFEDALCSIGILEDDDPRYVRKSSLEVESKQKEDLLEITIQPYESE